ncbi:MAG: sensory transduction histidine kinase [Verrucomicrobiales bacterium]|nr:sensory transduction histidine kinase [Verrucomicrobiales bacterium]
MNPATELPIRLAGRNLRNMRHICAFFHSPEERDKILMPFFKEGIDRGEKIFHVVDARHRQEHLSACKACGIDVESAEKSGQLEVRVWEDAYLKDGYFDGDRMVHILNKVLIEARQKYGLTRLMGNMEWALEALPGVGDIVEYEAKLNYLLPHCADPIVCVYDLNKHSGSVIMDILRTHPMVIVGGVLQENPLYVPPDEMLAELRARHDNGNGAQN